MVEYDGTEKGGERKKERKNGAFGACGGGDWAARLARNQKFLVWHARDITLECSPPLRGKLLLNE